MSEIVPVEPIRGELVEYRPRVLMTATEAAAMAEQVREMTRAVLRPGVDYMTIPGTKVPSLLKPGAEQLLRWFGLGHAMELVEQINLGPPPAQPTADPRRAAIYRCTVTKLLADGRQVTVSSCDGYAGQDEPKWAKAPFNTVIKMAQKRALVGATLAACGASSLFTQDMEDMRPERQPQSSRPMATEEQLDDIHTLVEGLDDAERQTAVTWWQTEKLPSMKDGLTLHQAEQVIGYLKGLMQLRRPDVETPPCDDDAA